MIRFLTPVLLAVSLFILSPQALDAQIPNPGFEEWTAAVPPFFPSMPVGWNTIFFGLNPNTIKSTLAHSGSAAVQGVTQDIGSGIIAPGYIASRVFAVNQRHAALKGFYQFTSVGNDEFEVVVYLSKNSLPIAAGESTFVPTGSTYVQFAVNIEYPDGTVPDSAQIFITNNPPPGSEFFHAGTTFLVDDLSFSGIVNSVQTVSTTPSTFALEQNYPNPFNPSTTIRFSLATESPVQLSVFNLIGQEVARPVDEQKAAGVYAVQFDASALPTGMYVYRLRAGNFTMARTMTLVR
jgi:hypothetical protein